MNVNSKLLWAMPCICLICPWNTNWSSNKAWEPNFVGHMDNISRYQRNPIKADDDRGIKRLSEIWEREWQVVWLWLKRMRSCLVDLYFRGRGRGLTNIGWRKRRSEKRRPDLKLEIECQSRTLLLLHFSWSLPCALGSLLAGSSESAFNQLMNIKPLRIEFHRTEKV